MFHEVSVAEAIIAQWHFTIHGAADWKYDNNNLELSFNLIHDLFVSYISI